MLVDYTISQIGLPNWHQCNDSFSVVLPKVAKVPTDDPVFRFLENRSKIDWSSRDFLLANTPGTVVAGSTYSFTVDADGSTGGSVSGGSAPGFLIKGMVF